MICNKCKKEIDDNSKFCGYCGNTINEKKKTNGKLIIGLIIGLVIVIVGVLAGVVVNNVNTKNKNEINNNDESVRYEKIDFTDFKIVLNDKEYKISDELKVSDFINNGWVAPYNAETLNQTIEELQKSMSDSDMIYVGYNSIYLEQDKLALAIYFDMSLPNARVLDSKVTAITIYNKEENKLSDFDFYGLKLGKAMTEKQYKEMFGEENFVMLEDDINHYYRKSLELDNDFEIGIELITRVDTNELVSITISEN